MNLELNLYQRTFKYKTTIALVILKMDREFNFNKSTCSIMMKRQKGID